MTADTNAGIATPSSSSGQDSITNSPETILWWNNPGKLITDIRRAGFLVHQGKNGDFMVCKHGHSRHCENFAELQGFAKKVGVPNA
jgi:hypothetical protein